MCVVCRHRHRRGQIIYDVCFARNLEIYAYAYIGWLVRVKHACQVVGIYTLIVQCTCACGIFIIVLTRVVIIAY